MPDRGLMEEAGIAEGIIDGTAPRELLLTGARVVQITFEVAQTAALAAMPGDVSRPVPPYGRLLVIDSSIARFSLLMVGGRYNMLPRNVLVQGVVEGDPAGLAAAIGGPLVAGEIELRRDGELLEATISDAAGLLATVTLPRLRVVDPSMLRWDAWLTQARVGARTPLFELVPRTELQAAHLSKGSTVQMENRPNGLWAGLRSLNMISACYAEGTLTLPPGTLQPPAA